MNYVIKNWSKFQAVKTRNAPWIMVYRNLLNDIEWHLLSGDHAKALINLWLIAGEDFGRLPDLKNLSFRLRISEEEVKYLISCLSHWIGTPEVNGLEQKKHGVNAASTPHQHDVNAASTPRCFIREDIDIDIDIERILKGKEKKRDVKKTQSYPQKIVDKYQDGTQTTVSNNPEIAATANRVLADDALPRHGPTLTILEKLADLRKKVLQ